MKEYPSPFSPGSKADLGSHTFEAEEIIRFASKYDPQLFHMDAEAAKNSVLGGLCASGWHTLSIWMKLMRAHSDKLLDQITADHEGYTFRFGPSPGFDNLKWLKPVFAGDTISYANEIASIRPSASRPPWHILQALTRATNQHGESVMTFESTVMLAFE